MSNSEPQRRRARGGNAERIRFSALPPRSLRLRGDKKFALAQFGASAILLTGWTTYSAIRRIYEMGLPKLRQVAALQGYLHGFFSRREIERRRVMSYYLETSLRIRSSSEAGLPRPSLFEVEK
jgi:hypothetical protein